jgi:hypothetical protein
MGASKFIVYTHMTEGFSFQNGGTVVQYLLCKVLEEYGQIARIYPNSNIRIPNSIFSKFYNNEFPIDDNCIVIYCEGTQGNPLNAPKVVRWMLSELGQNVPKAYLETWDKKELVYYFNSENKFYKEPEKINHIFKLLNVLYINPYAKNVNPGFRTGCCHTIRKAFSIHKNITYIHPTNSFEITRDNNQMQCISLFNKCKFFISYDSLTFLTVIAALCGCISVVYKVDGLSKQDWIKTTAANEYLQFKGYDNLFGIAYGLEDIPFAVNTLHMAPQQWSNIANYSKEKLVLPFINDMQMFENMTNTIQHNFYSE